MGKYILKRILISIPMVMLMVLFTFLIMQNTVGDFLADKKLNPSISEETIKKYEKLYQLDKPASVQFIYWFKNLFKLEFGFSFFYNIPVKDIIGGRLLNTFILSLSSFLFTWLIAIPLGIWAAVNRNNRVDNTIQFFSYIFLSFPSFFIAMILLYWSSQSGFLPLGGMYSPQYDDLSLVGKFFDVAKHLIIPTLALSVASIAALQRIMRGNMLEELGKKYILTARAKGLPENKVIYGHALRNAINPLITLLGYEFSALLSGAALIEIICSWPGLGSIMLVAVRSKDIYLVLTSMLMGGLLLILGNLVADILLAKADPRIRYEE